MCIYVCVYVTEYSTKMWLNLSNILETVRTLNLTCFIRCTYLNSYFEIDYNIAFFRKPVISTVHAYYLLDFVKLFDKQNWIIIIISIIIIIIIIIAIVFVVVFGFIRRSPVVISIEVYILSTSSENFTLKVTSMALVEQCKHFAFCINVLPYSATIFKILTLMISVSRIIYIAHVQWLAYI
jgi:hypothetical protein